MPSMKILEYTVKGSDGLTETIKADEGKFISKDELNALKSELEVLKKDVKKIKRMRTDDDE